MTEDWGRGGRCRRNSTDRRGAQKTDCRSDVVFLQWLQGRQRLRRSQRGTVCFWGAIRHRPDIDQLVALRLGQASEGVDIVGDSNSTSDNDLESVARMSEMNIHGGFGQACELICLIRAQKVDWHIVSLCVVELQ